MVRMACGVFLHRPGTQGCQVQGCQLREAHLAPLLGTLRTSTGGGSVVSDGEDLEAAIHGVVVEEPAGVGGEVAVDLLSTEQEVGGVDGGQGLEFDAGFGHRERGGVRQAAAPRLSRWR